MTQTFDPTVTEVENRPLTGGRLLLSLCSAHQAQATRPGQFAMVRLLGRSAVLLRRRMSIEVRNATWLGCVADCRLGIGLGAETQ